MAQGPRGASANPDALPTPSRPPGDQGVRREHWSLQVPFPHPAAETQTRIHRACWNPFFGRLQHGGQTPYLTAQVNLSRSEARWAVRGL